MPTKAWEELPMKLQPKEPNPDQLIMGQRVTFPPPSFRSALPWSWLHLMSFQTVDFSCTEEKEVEGNTAINQSYQSSKRYLSM